MKKKSLIALCLLSFSISSAQIFNVSNISELRNAISKAAESEEDDVIILADGVYHIGNDENGTLKYYSENNFSLTLEGTSSKNVILSGDNKVQILNFSSANHNAPLILKNITFMEGNNSKIEYNNETSGKGGAIYTDYTIDVIDCNFTKNNVVWLGGGFYSENKALVENSIFSYNKAVACESCGSGGGGFYAVHGATVKESTFLNNYSHDEGAGFVVDNFYDEVSFTVVENSNFINNVCGNYGGGFSASGKALVINSNFYNNQAGEDAGGGGFWAWKGATVMDSNFSYNITGGNGGGLSAGDGSDEIYIENCIFYRNSADSGGGVIVSGNLTMKYSQFIENNASYMGGGLDAGEGSYTIESVSFLRNNAIIGGGGIYFEMLGPKLQATLDNCKIYDNNGSGVLLEFNVESNVKINDCNISRNIGDGLTRALYSNPIEDSCEETEECFYSEKIYEDHLITKVVSSGIVEINNSIITKNSRNGINIAKINIYDSNISNNGGNGIEGSAIVHNSIISDNNKSGIKSCCGPLQIFNSIIKNNKDNGCVNGYKDILLVNSVVANNIGNGIYLYGGDVKARILNSLITGNKIGLYLVGRFLSSKDIYLYSIGYIYNSIFKDNIDYSIAGNIAYVNLYNNYINVLDINISSSGKNNIYDNVYLGFVDEINGDYRLTQYSDLIDAGTLKIEDNITIPPTDLNGNIRVIGNSIDIGPYEYNETKVGKIVNLQNGWSMIDIPSYVKDISKIDAYIIWKWDNLNKNWEVYSKYPNIMNIIKFHGYKIIDKLNPRDGVFIYETEPKKIVFNESINSQIDFDNLNKGWNLVGISKDNATYNLPSNIQIVWYWDNVNQKWKVYTNNLQYEDAIKDYINNGIFEKLDKLEKGKAFWFYKK